MQLVHVALVDTYTYSAHHYSPLDNLYDIIGIGNCLVRLKWTPWMYLSSLIKTNSKEYILLKHEKQERKSYGLKKWCAIWVYTITTLPTTAHHKHHWWWRRKKMHVHYVLKDVQCSAAKLYKMMLKNNVIRHSQRKLGMTSYAAAIMQNLKNTNEMRSIQNGEYPRMRYNELNTVMLVWNNK